MPESERLKSAKKKRVRRKKDKLIQKEPKNVNEKEYFLKKPTPSIYPSLEQFQFSDYEEDISGEGADNDASEDEFEDSKEDLSDNDAPISKPKEDFLTPFKFKCTFARTLQANSVSRPRSNSTPSTFKRPALSPANSLDSKKPRAQSKLPKKNN